VEELADAQLVIDTDIVIDHLRQRTTTLREAVVNHECALTAITLYELNAVPRLSERQRELLNQLRELVEVLPFDETASQKAADTWRALSETGQLIGVPDILIAGICLSNELPLLTRNVDHYGRVSGLNLINPDDLSP